MYSRATEVKTLRSKRPSLAALALFGALVSAYVHPASGQTSTTKTFSSAGEASNALFQATQNGDEQHLEAILGAGKDITSSGDEFEDRPEREQFIKKYQEMHRLVREADGSTVLYIGAENWPFPIPLVSSNGAWHFDSDAGRREILFRTVGENESFAIEVCDEFATATKKGAPSKAAADPIGDLAQQLYLRYATDAADASTANNEIFRGYYFQTKKVSGHTALIAYPAKYRSSGVMTFIVKDGVVYEKDLGPNTSTIASSLKARKLDSSWHAAE